MTWVNGRQLNSVNLGNNQTVGFSYNAGGQRLFKTTGNRSVMYYVVDGMAVGESVNNGQTTKLILYLFDENGDIYGINVNGSNYFFRKNLQGDVVGIWDNEGAQIVTYTYDPWGKLLSMTDNSGCNIGTLNPFRYRTYYYDVETGFYYLQSRYYDPETGRFVNADGYVSNGQSVFGSNMFAYCLNNPVCYADYHGESAAGVLKRGWSIALIVSQCDSPVPGPADAVALGIGIGSIVVAGIILIPWDEVGSGISEIWNSIKSGVVSLIASLSILKSVEKVYTRVKKARKNVRRFFEIWFDSIGAPILGKPLTREQAVSRVRKGLNVITYFSTDALNVANKAGGNRAVWHQRHGRDGYFNHYHVNGHANSAHIYYLFGG